VLTPSTPLAGLRSSAWARGSHCLLVAVTAVSQGRRHLAITQPWRGLCHHQFCLVIGIGHAGTLISAICCSSSRVAQFHQPLCRGDDHLRRGLRRMFPLIHVGRPWLGYWLLPYPNSMNVWPQFRSPLLWTCSRCRRMRHLGGVLVHRMVPILAR